MITDKQSLILCGALIGGIFIAGVLDVLSHYIVLTLLSAIFLIIIINLFFLVRQQKFTYKKKILNKKKRLTIW